MHQFQSSPAPRRGCCNTANQGNEREKGVSILTRAEARVLLANAAFAQIDTLVSILTRAEARVLRAAHLALDLAIQFQSSPAPRRGCCMSMRCCAGVKLGFNPHPRRGAGAAMLDYADPWRHPVSILTRAEARVLPA